MHVALQSLSVTRVSEAGQLVLWLTCVWLPFSQDLANHSGRLPQRLSLGCGTAEYSATRDHNRHDVDGLLLHVSVPSGLNMHPCQ